PGGAASTRAAWARWGKPTEESDAGSARYPDPARTAPIAGRGAHRRAACGQPCPHQRKHFHPAAGRHAAGAGGAGHRADARPRADEPRPAAVGAILSADRRQQSRLRARRALRRDRDHSPRTRAAGSLTRTEGDGAQRRPASPPETCRIRELNGCGAFNSRQGQISGGGGRAHPDQSFLSLSPNMPWAAPLTVSRASSSLSLASALPCWALPSASVSLSSVTLPKPSLAWPLSLSFAFSNFSSALIANLLESPHRSCALRRV